MQDETMTAQSALENASKELLEAQQIASKAVESNEQLAAQNKSLQETLAAKQVEESQQTDVIDTSGIG
jgi:regulator of replication initiation timing